MTRDWLTALASSGATALVSAAATDAWGTARAGFSKLFGRGDPERERITADRLDEAATQIEKLDHDRIAEVRETLINAWGIRLRDLLEERPDSAEELEALIEQVRAGLLGARQHWVQAAATGSVHTSNSGGINIANTGISGNITLHLEQPGPHT